MLNSDGEQIDLLTQELEKVDHVEPVTTTGGGVGQDGVTASGSGSLRERRSSLTHTIGSDTGIIVSEQEKLLTQQQPTVNSTNSTKMSIDSPTTSGRNTPTLTGRQKRQVIQESSTPPSLTGGTSSKHRSLT